MKEYWPFVALHSDVKVMILSSYKITVLTHFRSSSSDIFLPNYCSKNWNQWTITYLISAIYVVLQAKEVQILLVSDIWMFIVMWGRFLGQRFGPKNIRTLENKMKEKGRYTSMQW